MHMPGHDSVIDMHYEACYGIGKNTVLLLFFKMKGLINHTGTSVAVKD